VAREDAEEKGTIATGISAQQPAICHLAWWVLPLKDASIYISNLEAKAMRLKSY